MAKFLEYRKYGLGVDAPVVYIFASCKNFAVAKKYDLLDLFLKYKTTNAVQGVPAFRDFWVQRIIMKCGDHEFGGLFIV